MEIHAGKKHVPFTQRNFVNQINDGRLLLCQVFTNQIRDIPSHHIWDRIFLHVHDP